MTDPTLTTLAAAIDEMAQQRGEDKARMRASDMERRHRLLQEIGAIERRWNLTPTTKECREIVKQR